MVRFHVTVMSLDSIDESSMVSVLAAMFCDKFYPLKCAHLTLDAAYLESRSARGYATCAALM